MSNYKIEKKHNRNVINNYYVTCISNSNYIFTLKICGDDIEKCWKKNGILHRANKPAIIQYYFFGNYKIYFINGKRHNINGYAFVFYNEEFKKYERSYYINGKKIIIPKEISRKQIKIYLKTLENF